jgi:hypothetical protein
MDDTPVLIAFALVLLHLRRGMRARHRLTCASLIPRGIESSPWKRMLQGKDNGAYVCTMSIDVRCFWEILLPAFGAEFKNHRMPHTKEEGMGPLRIMEHPRPLEFPVEGFLALVLHWLCSCGQNKTLQMLFGIPPSTFTRYLWWAMNVLHHILEHLPECSISWPSTRDFERFAAMVNLKEPAIEYAFGMADGCKYPVATSGDNL